MAIQKTSEGLKKRLNVLRMQLQAELVLSKVNQGWSQVQDDMIHIYAAL